MENSQIKSTIKKMEEFAKQKKLNEFQAFTERLIDEILLKDAYNYSSKRELLTSINNISLFFGDYQNDENILEKLLKEENEKKLPNQDYLAFIMNLLGELHYYEGKFNSALTQYQKSLDIRNSLYGDSHPDTIESYTNLALLYTELGNFTDAEEIFSRALQIYESKISGHIEDYIKTLWNTGLMYQYWGKYSLAMEKYLTALEISQLNMTHELTDNIENNLGVLYLETGNYESAEKYLKNSFEYTRKNFGINHPKTITTLNNLVSSQIKLDKLEMAESGFSHLLKADKSLIPIISKKITVNYAVFLGKSGKTQKALKLLENCLDPHTTPELQIKILANIARIQLIRNQLSESLETITKAISLQKKTTGKNHIQYTKLLGLLGQIFVRLDKKDEAFKKFKEATELQNEILLQVSTSFSKDYAWNFYQKISNELNQLLSLFNLLVKEKSEADAIILEYMHIIFELLLRRKAIVFDAGIERLNHILKKEDPHLLNLFQTLMKTKEEIVLRTTKGYFPESPEENQKKILDLISEAEILENRISNLVPIYSLELKTKRATLKIIRNKIPEKTLFVDIFKFRFFDFFVTDKEGSHESYIIFYLSNNKTSFLILEDAKEIEDLIKKTDSNRNDLNRGEINNSFKEDKELTPESALRKIWQVLFKNQFQFDHSKLNTFCVSPDGEFFNLPFETLICENGNYLIENYRIQYVNSGRQLIYNKNKKKNNNEEIIIFADPYFEIKKSTKTDENPDTKKTIHTLFRNELTQFPELPGTADEAKEIHTVFKNHNIYSIINFNHEAVNDSELKNLESPKILHFATHGFYLENRIDIHPFSRCGIALSGINNILRGESIPPLFEDGMLTGMDILSLNLNNCDIVVLSACKTGKGQINPGQGVMGLCSALFSAGVSSVLVSLWNVPDFFTVNLMSDFYNKLALGMKKSEALKLSKKTMIKTFRQQWGEAPSWLWGGFILYGDDSPITENASKKNVNSIVNGEQN